MHYASWLLILLAYQITDRYFVSTSLHVLPWLIFTSLPIILPLLVSLPQLPVIGLTFQTIQKVFSRHKSMVQFHLHLDHLFWSN